MLELKFEGMGLSTAPQLLGQSSHLPEALLPHRGGVTINKLHVLSKCEDGEKEDALHPNPLKRKGSYYGDYPYCQGEVNPSQAWQV